MLDNGSGMAGFKELESATGMRKYFCTPIRRDSVAWAKTTMACCGSIFPRRISFHKLTEEMLLKAVEWPNNRPRKCLDYQTPAEVFNHALRGALAI